MPTAAFLWDYGFVKATGTSTYTAVQRLNVLGWYVRVVLETDVLTGQTASWHGVVSHVEDEHKGIVTKFGATLATGTQVFHCYGMEKILDTEYLSESKVDIGTEEPLVIQLPLVFNGRGVPNRNDRKLHLTYVFEGQALHPGGTLRPTAQWWSTRDIVKYLLETAAPKWSFRTRVSLIPFFLGLEDEFYLPTLDRPEIGQEGHTVYSLLNRLIDRRRLRAFYLEVWPNADGRNEDVLLRIVPWNASEIDTGIDGSDILKPNVQQIALLYDYSQTTAASIRTTHVQKYDRIVVRGARRTSTATWIVDADYLNPYWTDAEEVVYETAASGDANYATWDILKRQQRNSEARGVEKLSSVFSWFSLPDTWNGRTVEPETTTTHIVFRSDGEDAREKQCIHAVVFENYLPLYEHVDYSGDIIEDEEAEDPRVKVYRQPKVYFKIPTDNRWVAGDRIATMMETTVDPYSGADGRNFRWTAHVHPQQDTRTLEVRVSGEPQHVIAYSDFDKLTDDRVLGEWDYNSKKMLVTAALRDNRYAEGKYPPDGTSDRSDVDTQYGYVIYAGDRYRHDYVVPQTVLDVDENGALVTSNGGYVRDDTDDLNALARVAWEWWHQERLILTISTTQLTSLIFPGCLIVSVGDPTVAIGHHQVVNTVVSEVRITWPKTEGNALDVPVMSFVTGAGELDPMTLAPPESDITSRTRARTRR
jgi:hypothetical protein